MNTLSFTLVYAIASFPIDSAIAKSGFTCEQIKDKAVRKSCIDDRVESEAAEKEKAEKERAEISTNCVLGGYGKVECTFKNTSNVKGSQCVLLALKPSKDYRPGFFRDIMEEVKYVSFRTKLKSKVKSELKNNDGRVKNDDWVG